MVMWCNQMYAIITVEKLLGHFLHSARPARTYNILALGFIYIYIELAVGPVICN
jgi:hypothetical protein